MERQENYDWTPPERLDGYVSVQTLFAVIVICVLAMIVYGIVSSAYIRKSKNYKFNMQKQVDIVELEVAAECKDAFDELQTEITELRGNLVYRGMPFLDYKTYTMKILFPNMDDPAQLLRKTPELLRKGKGLQMFKDLIMHKNFLLNFIRTLESINYFSRSDRVYVASLIMITLQGHMNYCTDVMMILLAELIEKCIKGKEKKHPKLILRRAESVAEQMLSSWFTFLLYKFLKERAGEPLFFLFRAVKQQIGKGPVDALSSEVRYSLSEEKLIRHSIDFKRMAVYVSILPRGVFDSRTGNVYVEVLDCDTISQVKEKALDTIYRATPYSQRPSKDDLRLVWRTGNSGEFTLHDEDSTTKIEGVWKKSNTLGHYKVPDAACLDLVSKRSSIHKPLRVQDETRNLNAQGLRTWHLVKHDENDIHEECERGNKMDSEIYLARLLATKGTLQKFVDDLFEVIFSTQYNGSEFPIAIKYIFDFLDAQALKYGIIDPDVVHTWKSNALPLTFWGNLIKNPDFLFDIDKSHMVNSCLSAVAQTFVDSCSTADHRLGKNSPMSKFLFAKEIPNYKERVERHYSNIKSMTAVSYQDMYNLLVEESRVHKKEFYSSGALNELYKFAVKYNKPLIATLKEDVISHRLQFLSQLEQTKDMILSAENTAVNID